LGVCKLILKFRKKIININLFKLGIDDGNIPIIYKFNTAKIKEIFSQIFYTSIIKLRYIYIYTGM